MLPADLETLCAFVRDETRTKTDDDPLATEIQAALTVIGRREGSEGVVDLTSVHIPKALVIGRLRIKAGTRPTFPQSRIR